MHYNTILRFWFHELSPKHWWQKSESLDSLIAQRFSLIHSQASLGELSHWREDSLGTLAEIIILDQFSRNIFRDKAQAFANDSMALVLAQQAISRKQDKQLNDQEKGFLYLPFMHSESKTIHQQAVNLFSQKGLESNLEFEYKHKKIIDIFGRYPHRNNILGRVSTAEELAFLKEPGSSF